MKYTQNKGYAQPERTAESNDVADINVLADNFGMLDADIAAVEDAQAHTAGEVAKHTADKGNPHNVTAAQAGAYSREETDQRVAKYDGHVASRGNPHDTTAAQVGAYSAEQTNELLSGKLSITGAMAGDAVVVTDSEGNATTAHVTEGELFALSGVSGNIQQQLNNIAFYNYLPGLPMVKLQSGGDDFPPQEVMDAQVIPLIEAEYPQPAYRDAIIQNVETQNGAQRKAILWCYYNGTQNDGFEGWRYVTDIDTLIHRASGGVYGVVRVSGNDKM